MTAYSTIRPLSAVEAQAAKALDTSSPILAGCNWLRWIYTDGRHFEDHARIVKRFQQIMARAEFAAAN